MYSLDAVSAAATLLVLLPALAESGLPPGASQQAYPATKSNSIAAASHPLPRVIVDVQDVRGPRDAKQVQAKLRSTLWGSIVSCYAQQAQHNQKLQGDALIRMEVERDGKVIGTQQRGGDMPSAAVVQCWRRMLGRVELAQAPRGASVDVRIWVAPGDQPVGGPGK
jgi:hypothetical protein